MIESVEERLVKIEKQLDEILKKLNVGCRCQNTEGEV